VNCPFKVENETKQLTYYFLHSIM